MALDRGDALEGVKENYSRAKLATDQDIKVADANWRAYRRALDAGHDTYAREARKFDDFYVGEQWSHADKKRLEDEGRPALTINVVLSTVNAMAGEHATQRADFVYKPRRDATAETAHALTKLVDQILDNNDYHWKEALVFLDGVIQDRGFFDVRMEWKDHMQGEIVITPDDPICTIPDPDAKDYDPSTWNEVTWTDWLSLDSVSVLYGPDKAKKLESYAEYGHEYFYGADSVRFAEQRFGNTDQTRFYGMAESTEEEKRTIRSVRVIERQHKQLARVRRFVDLNTGDTREVPETWSDDKVKAFQKQFGLGITTSVEKRIRWTVTAGKCVLHDDWSPYKRFTKIPFFPYFRRGRPFGVVRNLISPQEQLNKIESQELHVVNTTANSGWIIETGSLLNMTKEELEARGAETGLVLEYARNRPPPAKIEPNQIPTGLDRVGMKSIGWVREISGVSDAMLGLDNPQVSGVAIQAKQQRGLTQMEVPFTNLKRTRQMLAEMLLELIQQFYTETRVLQVTNWEDPQQRTEELVVNGMTPEGRVVNDLTLGEYGVVAGTAPARDTFMESQFAEAIAMREVGIRLPDDVVIEMSNLSRKHDYAEQVRKATGRGEPTPQEAQLQQFQMEVLMRRAMLELQELEGKVMKLRADAAKAEAEAQNEGAIEQQRLAIETRLKLQEMENEMERALADLETKVAIAKMHADANASVKRVESMLQRMKTEKEHQRGLADLNIQREELDIRREEVDVKRLAARNKPLNRTSGSSGQS